MGDLNALGAAGGKWRAGLGRSSAALLVVMLLVTLACDPQKFPRTRQAATVATQAVGGVVAEAVEEVRPVATRALEKGREVYAEGKSAAAAAASRIADETGSRLARARAAATRASGRLREAATRQVQAQIEAAPKVVNPNP